MNTNHEVLLPLKYDGKLFLPGATVTLPADAAEKLVKNGVVAEASGAAEPAPESPSKKTAKKASK